LVHDHDARRGSVIHIREGPAPQQGNSRSTEKLRADDGVKHIEQLASLRL